ETCSWADVTAALLPFEDESPRAVLEEHLQETRRRHVQVSGNALRFEFLRLVRSATGDDRERGLVRANGGQLLAADFVGHEAENPDAPRLRAELRFRFGEELFGFGFAKQRKRQEWQRTTSCDTVRESGSIADSGHWALENRVLRAVRFRQRCIRGEVPE